MTDERGKTAEELRALAEDPRYSGRAEDLESLAAAVLDEDDVSWTGVDLIGAFSPGSTILVPHRHIAERVLGMLAGASVFLPVAWTWLSLHKAVGAYRDLLADDPEERRTFLALWTNGFDGRLGPRHDLVSLAMQSFMLILLAVAFIVLHRVAAEFNVVKEEKQASEAQRRLTMVLARTQRRLNERRSDDIRFLEAAVKRSMSTLTKAHTATRQGIQELDAAVQKAVGELSAASTTAVQELHAVTQKAMTEFSQVSTATHESVGSLITSASQAGAEAAASARAVSEATTSLTGATDTFISGVHRSIDRMHESLSDQQGQFVKSTQSALGDLTSGVSGLSIAQEKAAQTLAGLAELGQTSNTEVQGLLEALTRTLRDHESALQGQASEITRVADYAGQLLEEMSTGSKVPDPAGA